MQERKEHQPVLLQEAVDALAIKPAGIYIDGTFGRGGHAKRILERLNASGKLIVLDRDSEAIASAKRQLGHDSRVTIYHGSFAEIDSFTKTCGVFGSVSGILLDLGLSSPQLEDGERGFSFLREGPLDMRMDSTKGMTAAEWISSVTLDDLAYVLKTYGEERYAKKIARAILAARESAPIKTTRALAEIIAKACPMYERNKHVATRSFQAIRIFINRELELLNEGLVACLDTLAEGGRLVVISFHSLEDRIVKRFMRLKEKGLNLPAKLPVREYQVERQIRIIGKAIKPSAGEIDKNPRARSAIMRVAEKNG